MSKEKNLTNFKFKYNYLQHCITGMVFLTRKTMVDCLMLKSRNFWKLKTNQSQSHTSGLLGHKKKLLTTTVMAKLIFNKNKVVHL